MNSFPVHLAANTAAFAWKHRRYIKYSATAALVRSGINYYNSRSNSNNMPPLSQKRKHHGMLTPVSAKKVKRVVLKEKSKERKYKRKYKALKKVKEINRNEVEPIHGELERSFTYVTLGKKHKNSVNAGKWKYMDQFNSIYAGDSGQQYVGDVTNIFDISNFLFDSNNTSSLFPYALAKPLFNINPNQFNSGSSLYAAGQTPADDRFLVEEIILKFEWCNFTSASVALDLYLFQAKQSQALGPSATWDEVLKAQALGKSISAQPTQTGGTISALSQGYPRKEFLGQLPFTNPAFNRLWKKVSGVHFDLAPNASKFHEIKIKVNKMVDKEELNRLATAGNTYIKGLSHVLMAIARGQCMKDNNVTLTATSAIVEVGYVATREIHCSCVKASVSRIQTAYAVPVLLTNESAATLKQVNVVDTSQGQVIV